VSASSASPVALPVDGARAAGSPGVHAALSVIEHMVTQGPVALGDLARELGVPKSTLHRVCTVLVDRGWAVRDEHGRFQPGIRALAVGSRASDLPIITGFRRRATGLLERHDETVCLAVLDGDDSVFIAIEETSQPVRLQTWVGRRSPAFCSASGRVLLAAREPDAVAAQLGDGRPLVSPTGVRMRSIEQLLATLERTRRDGYAENHEETAIGLYTVSVPIANGAGRALAAMTMCVPTSRMRDGRRERLVADLKDAGRALSHDVAWLPTYDAKRL
jgi:IclR family transcriptional regulator, KDG regulon repressor